VEWLAPFGMPAGWDWAADLGRLRVRHPAGFLAVDVPLDGDDAAGQARRATARYTPGGPIALREVTPDGSAPRDGVARWIDWLAGYVRARLSLALGLEAPEHAARLLCVRSARVVVTPARVDVYFALAAHPIEIRLSGLDRDPAWVPAAGRWIAFHFE
jgi:hypothetical protein